MKISLKYNRNEHPETIWRFVLINIHYQNTCQVWAICIIFCNIFFKILHEKDGKFTNFINSIKTFHFHKYHIHFLAQGNKTTYVCSKCKKRIEVGSESMFAKFYRKTFCKTIYNVDIETIDFTDANQFYN